MKYREDQKVLFIAYYFPPVGGGGVQRSLKFVKYLPEFGWLPCVLTVKQPYDFYEDESLSADIPDFVPVYRSYSIEPMKWVRKFILNRWKNEISQKSSEIKSRGSIKHPLLVRLKEFLLVPDNEILWFPFAVWKGIQIIRKEKPQAIYSTASPFTAHLIAFVLSRLFHLPWNADFRDFWVDRPNFPRLRWRRFIDRKMESWVLKSATHLTTVSIFIGERYRELNPSVSYTTVPNGYDESDFATVTKTSGGTDKFTITYTGILNRERNPRNFLLAVHNLLNQRNELRERLHLKFIGQLDNPGDFQNYLLLKELGLYNYTDIIPYQKHHSTIREMTNATLLLLLVGDYKFNLAVLTGKIFEYLRAGRPILAVVPTNGAAAEVIRHTNSGVVVPNNNVEAISAGISDLFDWFQNGKLEEKFGWKNIEQFERKNLTRKLSEVLKNILKESKFS